MDRLHGVDALSVVCKRFSDGYEVVQCILEFYREMSEVEHSYADKILKLLGSANYTFHSNILMQWLGSDPFEEKGTVKESWQKMGTELRKLATLHAEKAENFADIVRQPLLELLPMLSEDKKMLKQQKQEMELKLKNAEKKLKKSKENYYRLGNTLEQCRIRKPGLAFTSRTPEDIEKDFQMHEEKYTQAHREIVELQQSLNDEVDNLLKDIQEHELQRVTTISKSLQEFAKTLSNTAPVYLETMQRIIISVDEVNGTRDIENFVMEHKELHMKPHPPPLELHPCSSRDPEAHSNVTIKEDIKDDKALPAVATVKGATVPVAVEEEEKGDLSNSSSIHNKAPPIRHTVPITRPKKPAKTTPTPQSPPTYPSNKTTPTNKAVPFPPKTKPPPSSKTTPTINPLTQALPTQAPPNHLNRSESIEKPLKTKPKSHTLSSAPPPPPPPSSSSISQDSLFAQLKHCSKQNDYYTLLGVTPTANQEELSKARRDLTSRLHPDHFTNDPVQQEKAQERLMIINQAYSDVLRNEVNRETYDQLVRYREKYHRILDQEGRALELAKTKLSSLRTTMRKARFPLPLLDELQIAIRLIEDKQEQTKS